jgi:uncharacterized membrane protein (DUF373 family)
VIYALTGLLLVGGALVVVVHAVFKFATSASEGVTAAVEASVSSLLIVFILVELLSAVRTVITERRLVAEPFLVVGILAAIKEMVSLSTFRIHDQKVADAMVTVGGWHLWSSVSLSPSWCCGGGGRRRLPPKRGRAPTEPPVVPSPGGSRPGQNRCGTVSSSRSSQWSWEARRPAR